MISPSTTAPTVTHFYAKCQVCKTQWQILSKDKIDAKGCVFCGAPDNRITVLSEKPDFSSAEILR